MSTAQIQQTPPDVMTTLHAIMAKRAAVPGSAVLDETMFILRDLTTVVGIFLTTRTVGNKSYAVVEIPGRPPRTHSIDIDNIHRVVDQQTAIRTGLT